MPRPSPDASSPRSVSIVMPTHDRSASLARTLDSLDALSVPADATLEVVLVLDGCTDDSAAVARRWRERTRFDVTVHEQPGSGPAAARNAGAALASGALLGFLDDDVVPFEGWLGAHLSGRDPDAGDVVTFGPLLLPPDVALTPWNEWEMLSLDKQYRAIAAGALAAGPRQFYTGNAMVSRRAFEALGGFDERLKRAEDVELGFRLERRGARFEFRPDAGAHHYARRSFASWRGIAAAYGRADVEMGDAHGHVANRQAAIDGLAACHPLTRAAVGLLATRPRAADAFCAGAGALGRAGRSLGSTRVSYAAHSAAFNVLYYAAMMDALGGRAAFERAAGRAAAT